MRTRHDSSQVLDSTTWIPDLRILVADQVLLSSVWYLAACWNPNPRMCNRIWGVVRNFIWGGKASDAPVEVQWDSLTLPLSSGGLRIIDPEAQSQALLAKLMVRGLALGREPWKEVGMATWNAINSLRSTWDPSIRARIHQAFRAEWCHLGIFGVDCATVVWCFLPPSVFRGFLSCLMGLLPPSPSRGLSLNVSYMKPGSPWIWSENMVEPTLMKMSV